MLEYLLYGVVFFLITLLIQYFMYGRGKNRKRTFDFWKGSNVVIILCVLGLTFHEIHYLASVIGFVIADEMGKKNGWHS